MQSTAIALGVGFGPGPAHRRSSPLMFGRGLVNRAVATFIAAGAGLQAMVALGATVYDRPALVVALAAATTSAIFAASP